MTHHDLLRKLHDVPFKPFRIRLSNGSAIDIIDPGSMVVGKSSAVVPTESVTDSEGFRYARDWKTISIPHIVEFINISETENGRRKRR